jgi:transcriptional regulator with XRE-family HTH domain
MTQAKESPKISRATILGQRINEHRKALGLKQGEFAKLIGLKQNSVSMIEQAERTPAIDKIQLIAETLNVPFEWLVGVTHEINGDTLHHALNTNSELAINRELLEKNGSKTNQLIEHKVKDAAMSPHIPQNSTAVIDMQKKQINTESVYLIEKDEQATLRRVRKEFDNTYTLIATNTEYRDLALTEQEFKNIKVIGKLVGHFTWAEN